MAIKLDNLFQIEETSICLFSISNIYTYNSRKVISLNKIPIYYLEALPKNIDSDKYKLLNINVDVRITPLRYNTLNKVKEIFFSDICLPKFIKVIVEDNAYIVNKGVIMDNTLTPLLVIYNITNSKNGKIEITNDYGVYINPELYNRKEYHKCLKGTINRLINTFFLKEEGISIKEVITEYQWYKDIELKTFNKDGDVDKLIKEYYKDTNDK